MSDYSILCIVCDTWMHWRYSGGIALNCSLYVESQVMWSRVEWINNRNEALEYADKFHYQDMEHTNLFYWEFKIDGNNVNLISF